MKAVNLIPSEQRRGGGVGLAGRSGGAQYVVVGLVGGLAALALLYGEADHEISAKQAQATKLSAEAARAQSEASKLAPYTSFVAMREERLKDVQELANTRFDWAHVMHELGRVLPTDASLSSVTATVGAATTTAAAAPAPAAGAAATSTAASTVTSATPPGSTPTFTIGGCATTQSEVALTMNRLRLMDGVSEVTLQSSSKGGGGGASGGGAGGCPAGDPVFSMQVSFDPLPAPTVKTPAPVATSTSNDTSSAANAATTTLPR
jgi:Tfp pilus assembly protein PilN